MQADGLEDVVEFSFYPVGAFLDGHKDCSHGGARDPNCEWDKLEACVVTNYCFNGNCTADVTVKVVNFLGCYAGDHGDDKSVASAKQCASDASLDFSPVQACFDKDGGEAAYKQTWTAAQQPAGDQGPWFAQAKCVPWVVVGGKLFSDASKLSCVDHNDSARLVRAICDAYSGDTPPAGCKQALA